VAVTFSDEFGLVGVAAAGLVGGIALLVRGFQAFRSAGRIGGTSTSRIASLAVGEVLVSGAAEPIELTLISPLQSGPSIYYRSRISRSDGEGDGGELFREERAVGFRVRDASGWVRVFPSGAAFDVPDRFDESSAAWGGQPIGLRPRAGSAFAPGPEDRAAQIAALLTVRQPDGSTLRDRSGLPLATDGGGRHYREARIEVGDTVTVTGRAVPFRDVADPAVANLLEGSGVDAADAEIALDIAEARSAGLLLATSTEAWGNASIPGFGIGQPIRPPQLDAAATPPPPADPDLAVRVAATFDIAPDALVLVSAPDTPLLIALGSPSAVTARRDGQFLLGLLGALVAIGSAMGLALVLDGGLR
jgi:hypothetical protein